jgi:general secretion pathway protein L
MINLDSNIEVRPFFKWWAQQLSFLLPASFREAVKGKGFLVIEISGQHAQLSYINNEQQKLLGEFEVNALAKEELQSIIASHVDYQDLEIVLRVPEHLSLKQDIFLPVATEANLLQVIAYELDKYTPFTKEQVYFDIIKLGPAKNKALLHIVLVLVKKSSLDTMYQHCLTLGIKPSFADTVTQPVVLGDPGSQYNLLPKDLCQKANKMPLFIMLGSMALSLVLFIMLLVLPLNTATSGLEALKLHGQKQARKALAIEDSKKGIDSLLLATQKLIDRKNSAPAMIDMVETVSKVLDDDTWVSQLRYVNKTLQLTGQSASASNLIASLEEQAIFHNVKFISPVTKDMRTGLERFRISTEVAKQQNDAEAE